MDLQEITLYGVASEFKRKKKRGSKNKIAWGYNIRDKIRNGKSSGATGIRRDRKRDEKKLSRVLEGQKGSQMRDLSRTIKGRGRETVEARWVMK